MGVDDGFWAVKGMPYSPRLAVSESEQHDEEEDERDKRSRRGRRWRDVT